MAETASLDAATRERRAGAAWLGAVIGLVVAGVAVGVAHLVAGVANPDASPLVAVGETAIDASPEWLKAWAIRSFGQADKVVLLLGIGVVLAAIAVAVGIASVRRRWVALAGLGTLGAVGVLAALTRPDAVPGDAIPTLAGAAVGALVLGLLRRSASLDEPPPPHEMPREFDRRRFLIAAGAGAVAAVAAGGAGTFLGRRARASASRADVTIPDPVGPAPPTASDGVAVPGLGPFHTPNDRFYRVDTALFVPAVEAEGWELRVHGMVERELVLDYRQLLARALIERDITLACVSNPVGGPYVGNARWVGAGLKDLLEEAGVRPGADQLVSRSVDGFTIGTPTAAVTDGRDALLAVSMNGEPLPLEHGFPVRMVVPGLYGYVSAMKWLVELELTTFASYDAYWVQRGWAEQAPIKTMSRIDTPAGSKPVRAGRVPIAGVAWAQHRGIERVEVRVDDGAWLEAELTDEGTIDTWRQWVAMWDATPGEHRLQVRATDGDGVAQPEDRAEPFPDGAAGWHTVVVQVA
ncbi:MAG TPA: molybdopterin-dependent oxidoreductase [Actinomycetota bacterium]|nr:molybdopterin-dependent oxidoreductase [Actinomycetota bacterium]